jgi:hypothetical protein
MLFGEGAVSGTDLGGGAIGVEAERGVVIWSGNLQARKNTARTAPAPACGDYDVPINAMKPPQTQNKIEQPPG